MEECGVLDACIQILAARSHRAVLTLISDLKVLKLETTERKWYNVDNLKVKLQASRTGTRSEQLLFRRVTG